jgi:NAD(P)-dependent dehydrogenase (short-subunit alcohol dehydrogenase family)
MNPGFKDKVALVTGAASGIGRAAARRLAAEGASVVAADLNGEGAAATVAMIEQAGGRAIAVTANIVSPQDNQAMFDAADARFGGLDMAFLNAGRDLAYTRFANVNVDMLDTMYQVNLRGPFLGMQLALSRLRPGGACVVTASMAGVLGISEVAPYAAAKHGVVGLVKSAARDFAERKLRVNLVCPGLVLTPMTGFAQDDTLVDDLLDPEYRCGVSAQHVAEVAIFLLSRRSAGVNGHVQMVDAGAVAAYPPLPDLTMPGERES